MNGVIQKGEDRTLRNKRTARREFRVSDGPALLLEGLAKLH